MPELQEAEAEVKVAEQRELELKGVDFPGARPRSFGRQSRPQMKFRPFLPVGPYKLFAVTDSDAWQSRRRVSNTKSRYKRENNINNINNIAAQPQPAISANRLRLEIVVDLVNATTGLSLLQTEAADIRDKIHRQIARESHPPVHVERYPTGNEKSDHPKLYTSSFVRLPICFNRRYIPSLRRVAIPRTTAFYPDGDSHFSLATVTQYQLFKLQSPPHRWTLTSIRMSTGTITNNISFLTHIS